MSPKEQFEILCQEKLEQKGFKNDKIYEKRLKQEFRQIDAQDEHNYFLNLYNNQTKYPYNEHNQLISYLLDIVPDFDIKKSFAHTYGDFPDIDVDYIGEIKDYLKNEWAPKTFGPEYVCSIGTYSSLGVKQAILDTVKTYGMDKSEIQAITVRMSAQDEEGEKLSWEDALELYPDFKAFCDKNPEIAKDAELLMGRTKSRGVHPGGLVISSVPIADFLPLETTKDEVVISAWGEGLKTQDLQPVGFVKFDVLTIKTLDQISLACKLIKERHNLNSICALEKQKDWSDEFYLNDPKCIKMAHKADLKAVFQFDSEGIRKLTKESGVSRFEDLVAINSLFRPGPLQCLPHTAQILSKKERVKYRPLVDLYPSQHEIGYINKHGNLSFTKNYLKIPTGRKKLMKITLKATKQSIICSLDHRILIKSKDPPKRFHKPDDSFVEAKNIKFGDELGIFNGYTTFVFKKVIEIELLDEEQLCFDICVQEEDVYKGEPNFIADGFIVHNSGLTKSFVNRKNKKEEYTIHPLLESALGNTYGIFAFQEAVVLVLHIVGLIPMKDCMIVQKAISKKQVDKFKKYKDQFIENGQKVLGQTKEQIEEIWNQIEKFAKYAFNLSHCTSYTATGSRMLYLKAHYPLEFYSAILMKEDQEDKIKEYKIDAKKHGIIIEQIDLNKSDVNFSIKDDKIYYGFNKIKGISKEAQKIVEGQPYTDLQDFLDKFGTSANILKPLIALGCFEGDKIDNYKFVEYYRNLIQKDRNRDKRHGDKLFEYEDQLRANLPEEYQDLAKFDEETYEKWKELFSEDMVLTKKKMNKKMVDVETPRLKVLENIVRKKDITIENYTYKKENQVNHPKKEDFYPTFHEIKDKDFAKLLKSPQSTIEETYYGFQWNHPVELSPDFDPNLTIDSVINEQNLISAYIQVQIKSCVKKTSKNNTEFYSVMVEDYTSKQIRVTVWNDDYNRFKEEFKKGNLVSMKVRPPSNGFMALTFFSPPKQEKWKLPKNKADDMRLIVLTSGETKN